MLSVSVDFEQDRARVNRLEEGWREEKVREGLGGSSVSGVLRGEKKREHNSRIPPYEMIAKRFVAVESKIFSKGRSDRGREKVRGRKES